MKKVLAATVAASMLLVVPALEAGAAKKKAAPKPMTVMVDPAGDAGNAFQNVPVPVATEAGLDLTKGIIGQKGKNITFTAEHAAMPASGSAPEGFRLIWGLVVGNELFQMSVKSVDVGKPDVVGTVLLQDPQGEERVGTVYQGVARLEQCGTVESPAISFSACKALGYHKVTFNAAKKTASWSIPMKDIKAKRGTKISAGGVLADTGCMICWVPQYAERSLTPTTIVDNGTPTKIYKVG